MKPNPCSYYLLIILPGSYSDLPLFLPLTLVPTSDSYACSYLLLLPLFLPPTLVPTSDSYPLILLLPLVLPPTR